MTKSKLSEKLKKAFRESGLTQEELAKILNVRQTQVSRLISGHSQLTLDKFEKLLEVFDKDANYFFENSGTISHSGNISHSGSGDIATGQSAIKKSPNNPSDLQCVLAELQSLKTEIKKLKKSK